jgi:T5SS/PEP-CTERM-associated repeat protein
VRVINKGKLNAPADELDLGNEVDSNGKLEIDGDGTEVNVGSNLYIGQRGTGVVELKKKGKLTVPGVGIFLGTQAEGDGTLILDGDGAKLDFNGQLIVADFGKGKISLQNGADFTTGDLTLGHFASSTGTLEVKGTEQTTTDHSKLTTTGHLIAGAGGKGEVLLSDGGRLTTEGEAIIGEGSALGTTEEVSLATITDPGSVWTINSDLTVGKRAKAALTLKNGGWVTVAGGLLTIGEFDGSDGKISIEQSLDSSSPRLVFNDIVRVGKAGKGELSMSGESLKMHVSLLSLGSEETGDGTVTVAGQESEFTSSGEILIGGEGKGKLEVKELAEVSTGSAIKIRGTSEDKRATATVAGHEGSEAGAITRSKIEAQSIFVGESGYGTLTIEDGGIAQGLNGGPMDLRVGMDSGHGKLELTNGQVKATKLDVDGTSEITANSASVLKIPTVNISSIGSTGTTQFKLNGSSQLETHNLIALNGSDTTINGSGAKISLDEMGQFSLGGSAQDPAKLTLQAGAIEGTGASLLAGGNGKAIVNVSGTGRIEVGEIIVGHISQAIQGDTQFTAAGSSTSTGANTITVHKGATLTATSGAQIGAIKEATINGTVNVLGGSMAIGDFSEIPTIESGAVSVGPNGTLYGGGTIKGDLYGKFDGTVTGKRHPAVSAGKSPGILTVEGNVVLDAGTILEMEIGGATPGTQHDQIVALGSINFAGDVNLSIVNSGSGFQLPSVGSQFTLLSAAGGVTASFMNGGSLYSVAGGSRVSWAINSTSNASVLQATSITPLIDGDYNGDGAVNAADYVIWRKSVGGINLAADGNRDGLVDALDEAVWRSHFGTSAGSGNAAVPEPSVAAIVMCLILRVMCVRRGY